jgi:hypothetical protein
MGALLGAVLGVGLAFIVDNADTSGAVVAPGRERAGVLAAGPPSSRPPVSRAAGSADSAASSAASGSQQPDAANQAADQKDRKADKSSKGPHDKPGKDKGRSK